MELIVEGDSLRLIVPRDLRSGFGVDGERAVEVARLINASRRVEVGKEVRS